MKQFLTNTVWAFKSSRKVPPPLRSRRRAPLAVEALEDRLVPSTFWVTNTLDSGPGSLRQAILGANAHPGRDAINFAIPGAGVHTIAPRSALPAITDPVVINGTTQPGYAGAPLVQLDGTAAGSASAAGPGADGLHISAGSSTVRGLIINRFANAQVHLDTRGNDVIAGNYLGLDATGTRVFSRGGDGIEVEGTSGDRIGGTSASDRNLIAAFGPSSGGYDGIALINASGTTIEGNYIGTDKSGAHPLAGQFTQYLGIAIWGGSGDTVGGTAAGAGNVIANSADDGLYLDRTTGATVAHNHIGTNAAGTGALPNGGIGVCLGATTFSSITGNILSGNVSDGLVLANGSNNNVAQGNWIGVTAVGGWRALGNGWGIRVIDSSYNLIGGVSPGDGNVISANAYDGILIEGGAYSPAEYAVENAVRGNFIGTDPSGALRLGNGGAGVFFWGTNSATANSYGNQIGGSAPWLNGGSWGPVPAGAGNVIAFNARGGVEQVGPRMFNNPVRGNSIHDNGGLPIDADTLPHFTPVVQFAHAGPTTTVGGYVSDAYAEQVLLDFYASNPSESGQGRRYLGSAVVRASDFANGRASFSAHVGATRPGEVVTVTATGYYGNTSRLDTGKPALGLSIILGGLSGIA